MTEFVGDIAIKIGEYEKNGEKKGEFRRIGRLMRSDDGPFVLLNADALSMQLFALANKDRRSSVICSVFEPRDGSGGGRTANPDDEPF